MQSKRWRPLGETSHDELSPFPHQSLINVDSHSSSNLSHFHSHPSSATSFATASSPSHLTTTAVPVHPAAASTSLSAVSPPSEVSLSAHTAHNSHSSPFHLQHHPLSAVLRPHNTSPPHHNSSTTSHSPFNHSTTTQSLQHSHIYRNHSPFSQQQPPPSSLSTAAPLTSSSAASSPLSSTSPSAAFATSTAMHASPLASAYSPFHHAHTHPHAHAHEHTTPAVAVQTTTPSPARFLGAHPPYSPAAFYSPNRGDHPAGASPPVAHTAAAAAAAATTPAPASVSAKKHSSTADAVESLSRLSLSNEAAASDPASAAAAASSLSSSSLSSSHSPFSSSVNTSALFPAQLGGSLSLGTEASLAGLGLGVGHLAQEAYLRQLVQTQPYQQLCYDLLKASRDGNVVQVEQLLASPLLADPFSTGTGTGAGAGAGASPSTPAATSSSTSAASSPPPMLHLLTDQDGDTALHRACAGGHFPVVVLLLGLHYLAPDAEIDIRQQAQAHRAARVAARAARPLSGSLEEEADDSALLDLDLDLDAWTHAAYAPNSPPSARAVAAASAVHLLDCPNGAGDTPLLTNVRSPYRHDGIIQLLVSCGADVHTTNKDGLSAYGACRSLEQRGGGAGAELALARAMELAHAPARVFVRGLAATLARRTKQLRQTAASQRACQSRVSELESICSTQQQQLQQLQQQLQQAQLALSAMDSALLQSATMQLQQWNIAQQQQQQQQRAADEGQRTIHADSLQPPAPSVLIQEVRGALESIKIMTQPSN